MDKRLIRNQFIAQSVNVIRLLWVGALFLRRGFNRFWIILSQSFTERFPRPLCLFDVELSSGGIGEVVYDLDEVEGVLWSVNHRLLVDFIKQEHNVTLLGQKINFVQL